MSQSDDILPTSAKRSQSIVNVTSNVLIVEDDKDTADFIGAFLLSEGYGARVVGSREDAISVIDSYIYDFILMDLFMPGLSAEEFVKEIRWHCPFSRIILMTASERVAADALKLGIHFCIGKPFKPETLLELLQTTPLVL
jgi:DNA-binding response OmpR family regulator